MLEIHENAKANFNSKTEEILFYFEVYNEPKRNYPKSEHFSVATITDKEIIGEIRYHYITNIFGENVGLVTHDKSGQYYINEENYKKIRILIEQIANLNDVKKNLSIKYIENMISDWIIKRFFKEIELQFIDFLLEGADNSIKDQEIWIPIPYTSTVNEFKIGKIEFRTVTEKIIRDWFEPMNVGQEKSKKQEEDKALFIRELQEEIQGYIAGIIKIVAEPIKAKEIAYYEVSKSLSILRLLCPANFIPQLIVGAYEYGWKSYESEKSIIFSDSGKSFSMTEGIKDKGLHWTITDKEIDFMKTKPFLMMESLITNEKKNDFQEKIYNALLIYSKHSLKRDVSDKLMYVLVSLESILLKNDTEPIQHSLSDRIAFILAEDTKSRQYIAKKIKEIYQIRSKFIHHGMPSVHALDTITEFLDIGWKVFINIISNSDNFRTKDEFLNEIDNIKYS